MEIGLRGKEEKKLSKLSELKYTVAIVKPRFFSIFNLKIMKKCDSTKYCISWINTLENDRVYDIKLELPNQCTVEDCIIQALKYLNHQFKLLNSPQQFKEKACFYEIYHAKKNGHPKEDYPCTLIILYIEIYIDIHIVYCLIFYIYILYINIKFPLFLK